MASTGTATLVGDCFVINFPTCSQAATSSESRRKRADCTASCARVKAASRRSAANALARTGMPPQQNMHALDAVARDLPDQLITCCYLMIDPDAHHVADLHPDAPGADRDEVEPVPADAGALGGRVIAAGGLHPRHVAGRTHQRVLEGEGDMALLLVELGDLLLGPLVLGDVPGDGAGPDDDAVPVVHRPQDDVEVEQGPGAGHPRSAAMLSWNLTAPIPSRRHRPATCRCKCATNQQCAAGHAASPQVSEDARRTPGNATPAGPRPGPATRRAPDAGV